MPTYDRRRSLERALAALDRQTLHAGAFEVVVVDDGSSDGTGEWLARRAALAPYALRVLRQRNGGPSCARNAGVAAARAELLVFLDDDVSANEGLLAEHVRAHEAAPDLVVIGTLASLPGYAEPWLAWQQDRLEKQYEEMIRGDFAPTYRNFWTGNASVAKRHVVGAGGFDETLRRGEDVELGQRLAARGLRFVFDPAARALHHAERSFAAFVGMHRSYGAADVAIFGKLGPERLVEILAHNYSCLHPITRALVRRTARRPAEQALAARALGALVKSPLARRSRRFAGAACGALANVGYWQTAAAALDDALLRDVFRRGEARARRGFRGG